MTEIKKDSSNNLSNNPENKNKLGEEASDKDKVDEEDTGKDNAIQNLIYHSFYVATCIVPLEENLITINETVPELMKAKEQDPILQETIKTFHTVMKEKDDEILNLRKQINKTDVLPVLRSEILQTDLTLEDCDNMERQILAFAKDIPEKNEKIHQLQEEIAKKQKDIDDSNIKLVLLQNQLTSAKPKDPKMEDDLEEAYKNLLELEEKNSGLQKQILEMTEKYKHLQYQFEDIQELKMEIEDAKIQTEDELNRLKQQQQQQQQQQLKSKTFDQTEKVNENVPKNIDFDDVICELKDKLYQKPCQSQLLLSLPENVIFKYGLERLSDSEIINKLIDICCDETETEQSKAELVSILKSISYNDNGNIDIDQVKSNMSTYRNAYDKASKDELTLEALTLGLQLKTVESISRLDIGELQKEYMKLENILNIIHKYFKLTPLSALNRMSRKELIDGIVEKMIIILNISLHGFWNFILNNPVKEEDVKKLITLSSINKTIVCESIFPRFSTEEAVSKIISLLMEVRNVTVHGKALQNTRKEYGMFFMKMYGANILYDLSSHVLPKYPRNIRCNLLETSIEDTIMDQYKIHESLSQEFLSSFLNGSSASSENNDSSRVFHGVSWIIFDIFSTINFEDELFAMSTTAPKMEISGQVLTLSTNTKKIEKSLIRLSLQKNIKSKLIDLILKIQFILDREKVATMAETCKSKLEMELVKMLIKKKEMLVKFVFKDTFSPAIEKITFTRNDRYLSSISKDKNNVDFWIKMVLEKYHKEQVKEFQNVTEDEMKVYYKRLAKSVEILCPHFSIEYPDNKNNKRDMVKSIFLYRNIVLKNLHEILIGKRFTLSSTHELQEMLLDPQIDETLDHESTLIKKYFELSDTSVSLSEMSDVLQRLYKIDCELYPDFLNSETSVNVSKKLQLNEIVEEIIVLRFGIASNMVFLYKSLDAMETNAESDAKKWSVLKQIENAIINSQIMEIDKHLIDDERHLINNVLKACKRSQVANDSNLKKAFLDIKKISCAEGSKTFDVSENERCFDRITTTDGKVQIICEEVEKIINSCRHKFVSDNGDKESFVNNYNKLESLLEDMEVNISKESDIFKNSWIYGIHSKVKDIHSLISNEQEKETVHEKSLRYSIDKNLQEIYKYVASMKELQTESLNRLNNVTRKFRNFLPSHERKASKKSSQLKESFCDINDEKVAFERAFSKLEQIINEIDVRKPATEDFEKMIEKEIMNKNDEELRKIIVTLENDTQTASKYGTSTNMNKTPSECEKTREQLEEDCSYLVQKGLVKKIKEMFHERLVENVDVGKNNLTKFEQDINLKLMKYQDLCDSADRLRIPSAYMDEKFSPIPLESPVSISKEYKGKESVSKSNLQKSNIGYNDTVYGDSYFQNRLNEMQKYGKYWDKTNISEKGQIVNYNALNSSNVLVDGFEIEDEKTPRYYSMRLQDIQHEMKEDELGNVLYQMEQYQTEIVEKNKNLQHQLFISQNLIENLQSKLDMYEKSDGILRKKVKGLETNGKFDQNSSSKYEDIKLLKNESKKLTTTLASAHQQLDHQNTELINLATLNNNLLLENTNLSIKCKYLQRSFLKLEELYEDLVHQLEYLKLTQSPDSNENYKKIKDSVKERDFEKLWRKSENDKMELVKTLDIIDQQNELLKIHCEKLDSELSLANKNLAESQSQAESYFKQAEQLTYILDSMNSETDRYQSAKVTFLVKQKEEEIKRLQNKIVQLEIKLMETNQI